MALAELYGVQYQIDEDTGEMSKAQIWDPNANDRRGGYVDIKPLLLKSGRLNRLLP